MTHTAYTIQLPDKPGMYARFRGDPRSGEVVSNPLLATSFWTEQDARDRIGYGDFWTTYRDRPSDFHNMIGAHVIRLTLDGGTEFGTWKLEDLGE